MKTRFGRCFDPSRGTCRRGAIKGVAFKARSSASPPRSRAGTMCWNAPVSIFFGLLGLCCAGFLYHVGKKAEVDPSSTRWGRDC